MVVEALRTGGWKVAHAARSFLLVAWTLGTVSSGCGGESQAVLVSLDAGLDGDSDGLADVPTTDTDTETESDAPVLVDPPANGPCVKVSTLPNPVGELPYGRMFFSGPGELWSVSGTTPFNEGGTFVWTEQTGWEFVSLPSSAPIWAFSGVTALATLDDAPAFGNTTERPFHEDISALNFCSSWFLAESLGMPWIGNNGGCAQRRLQAILVYPGGDKYRILSFGRYDESPRLTDSSTGETFQLQGWIHDDELWYLRYTAVGRWHVRSGRLTKVAVIDLDALQMKAVDGVPAIDGYGAVAVRDHEVWLHGVDESNSPVLARIDPATASATLFDASGLPRPGIPNIEQDLLAHDGSRLWKLRFDEGSVIVGTLDLATQSARVHPVVGDVEAARALFLPAQANLLEPGVISHEFNGFRPPESLRVLPIGEGEIVVARQWGEFAGVRISLTCP